MRHVLRSPMLTRREPGRYYSRRGTPAKARRPWACFTPRPRIARGPGEIDAFVSVGAANASRRLRPPAVGSFGTGSRHPACEASGSLDLQHPDERRLVLLLDTGRRRGIGWSLPQGGLPCGTHHRLDRGCAWWAARYVDEDGAKVVTLLAWALVEDDASRNLVGFVQDRRLERARRVGRARRRSRWFRRLHGRSARGPASRKKRHSSAVPELVLVTLRAPGMTVSSGMVQKRPVGATPRRVGVPSREGRPQSPFETVKRYTRRTVRGSMERFRWWVDDIRAAMEDSSDAKMVGALALVVLLAGGGYFVASKVSQAGAGTGKSSSTHLVRLVTTVREPMKVRVHGHTVIRWRVRRKVCRGARADGDAETDRADTGRHEGDYPAGRHLPQEGRDGRREEEHSRRTADDHRLADKDCLANRDGCSDRHAASDGDGRGDGRTRRSRCRKRR